MHWMSEGVSGVWTGHSGEQFSCHCEQSEAISIL